MTYSLNIKKLFTDLRGPRGAEAIKDEAQKIKTELKHLSDVYRPQAKAKLRELEGQYKVLVGKIRKAQVELEKEAKKTVSLLKNLTKSSSKAKAASRTKKTTKKSAKSTSKKLSR